MHSAIQLESSFVEHAHIVFNNRLQTAKELPYRASPSFPCLPRYNNSPTLGERAQSPGRVRPALLRGTEKYFKNKKWPPVVGEWLRRRRERCRERIIQQPHHLTHCSTPGKHTRAGGDADKRRCGFNYLEREKSKITAASSSVRCAAPGDWGSRGGRQSSAYWVPVSCGAPENI